MNTPENDQSGRDARVISADLLGDLSGIAVALAHQGKMNEWNKTVCDLYTLADELEAVASSGVFPEWSVEKALRLRRLAALFPHVSA